MIHPTAIIHPSAEIAEDVTIGPYCLIGEGVRLASGNRLLSHVVLQGPSSFGEDNCFHPFSTVGGEPQDKKFRGDDTTHLEVGKGNIFRESVTVNRGTKQGGSITKIGDSNLFMAYVHIAHDCIVGNGTIFANNASLSGHVIVDDFATLSGFSAVRQFTRVGAYSFVAGGTMVVKDILPYILVSGDPAEPYGLNAIGLQRHDFSPEVILQLKRAYKIIFRQNLTTELALEKLQSIAAETPEVQLLIDGLNRAERGVSR